MLATVTVEILVADASVGHANAVAIAVVLARHDVTMLTHPALLALALLRRLVARPMITTTSNATKRSVAIAVLECVHLAKASRLKMKGWLGTTLNVFQLSEFMAWQSCNMTSGCCQRPLNLHRGLGCGLLSSMILHHELHRFEQATGSFRRCTGAFLSSAQRHKLRIGLNASEQPSRNARCRRQLSDARGGHIEASAGLNELKLTVQARPARVATADATRFASAMVVAVVGAELILAHGSIEALAAHANASHAVTTLLGAAGGTS